MMDVRDREPAALDRDEVELAPPREGLVPARDVPARDGALRDGALRDVLADDLLADDLLAEDVLARDVLGREVAHDASPYDALAYDALARDTVVPASVVQVPREPRRKRGIGLVGLSLILLVLLPIVTSGIYLFALASDQYVAEARFMVRQTEPLLGSSLEAIASSQSSSRKSEADVGGGLPAIAGTIKLGGEDAEIVASYIHSRAIVGDVSRKLDVRAIFQRPEADFWARLPRDASAEDLSKYWNRMVMVNIEATSGIVTVRVSAFRREDALLLAQAIITSGETLANQLSLKVRSDMMTTAEDEVGRAEGEVRATLTNLTDFRNARRVLDPEQSALSNGKLLVDLMAAKIEAEGQIFVAERVQGPKAPGMATLRDKLASINDHIDELNEEMAGSKAMSGNMAATLAQFETLELKKRFAETMYKFASNGVERARIASERQQIYVEVFEPPLLPQDDTYPARWADILLISFGVTMVWICGATVAASIVDHRL